MKKIFNAIKVRIQSFNYREKALLLSFMLFLTLFWLSGCFKQLRHLSQELKFVNAKIKNNQFWIKNKSVIEKNLEKVLSIMDPEKTFSGAAFSGEVENVIRTYDLNYSMTSPRTRQGDIFDVHTLQLHCENANLAKLIQFEESIYQKKPYISLEKIKMHANLFNPDLLEVDFTLKALELKDILHEK